MKILLDQAVYDQRNKGNVALLQTAVRRLSGLWTQAKLYVLTEAPYSLKLYCPGVYPVGIHPWQNYSYQVRKFDLLGWTVSRFILRWLLEFREEFWHRYPGLMPNDLLLRSKTKQARSNTQISAPGLNTSNIESGFENRADDTLEGEDVIKAVQNADLVVATGGGYLCDGDKRNPYRVFNTLETAVRLGKKTAMVGQGVGPLNDPDLRLRLSRLLPQVDVILVREPKIAAPLLESLGVDPRKISTTGDDAIEMAYAARAAHTGNCIGINIRLAQYTKVEPGSLETIRQTLHRSAKLYSAPLMALPTSSNALESDLEYIRKLLDGYGHTLIDWRRYSQPIDLIRKIGRCRLVISGAFHPALLALAQGIPAIGLYKSTYSYNKFAALYDEFGPACQIHHLEDESFGEKLAAAIDTAWNSAEEVKLDLLDTAVRQIELGKAGYRRIFNLFANN